VTTLGEQIALFEQYVWRYFDGLTDEELQWEPVSGEFVGAGLTGLPCGPG
jgi:hypothetical protein